MKANELMIGDWVLSKKRGKDEILQVVTTDGGSNTAWLDGDSYSGLVKGDDIFPIPLTTEILEKNGFEVQDQGGGRQDVWIGSGLDCEDDIEVEFQYSIPTYLKIDCFSKGVYYTSTNIKYVHLLQHALRLCGIDKEIKL